MIKIHIDGASKGNPGIGASGIVVLDDDLVIAKDSKIFEYCTNNEAEYQALLLALHYIDEHELDDVTIYSDSELVVNQMNSIYQCKNRRLLKFYGRAKNQMKGKNIRIEHIHREKNRIADRYVNQVLRDYLQSNVISS